RQLFDTMLYYIDEGPGGGDELYPDFNPALTWLSGDMQDICTLLPLDQPPTETDRGRLLVKAFCRFATGMDSEHLALAAIANIADEQLLPIVILCRSSSSDVTSSSQPEQVLKSPDKDNIMAALKRSLTAKRAAQNSQETPLEEKPSSALRGLARVAGMHALK